MVEITRNIWEELRGLSGLGYCSTSPLKTLRVKVWTSCQWSCYYCHHEGSLESESLSADREFESTLRRFKETLGIREVHFTGGEPTLQPEITDFVRMATECGFTVKITTNGQVIMGKSSDLVRVGLRGVNISIPTLSGKKLGALQAPRRSVRWGERQIANQVALLLEASQDPLVEVKVNTVVSYGDDDALGVFRLCEQCNIPIRWSNNLYDPRAYQQIGVLLDRVSARAIAVHEVSGSSSFRVEYETTDRYHFAVKMIRPFKIPSLCDGCPIEQMGECAEYVYGLRLEKHHGEVKIRLCLHRDEPSHLQPLDRFWNSASLRELSDAISADNFV